jgi:hypothetical protein
MYLVGKRISSEGPDLDKDGTDNGDIYIWFIDNIYHFSLLSLFWKINGTYDITLLPICLSLSLFISP